MADYIRRVFRTFSKLFITEEEQKEQKHEPERFRPRTPPKYFTPLRPVSRVNRTVPHNLRRSRSSTSAGATPARRSCPIIQCPSQISLKKFSSDSDLSLKNEGNIRMKRESFDRHFVEENEGTIPMRNNESEISQPPSYKSSNSSFDYFSTIAGDEFDPSESCHNMFPFRRQFGKNKQILHPARPCSKSCSKIPRPNCRNQRGVHTLTTQQSRNMGDVDRSQQAGGDNNVNITPSDIGNWIEFRRDTTARFEMVFKSLSRKKGSFGNLMDSSSHARWMQLSGIGVERDAQMFKLFAGGKVVLNMAEYKYLLQNICRTYELEYWDVLRKMAMTYQREDPEH